MEETGSIAVRVYSGLHFHSNICGFRDTKGSGKNFLCVLLHGNDTARNTLESGSCGHYA